MNLHSSSFKLIDLGSIEHMVYKEMEVSIKYMGESLQNSEADVP